jgi:hypothetical protein
MFRIWIWELKDEITVIKTLVMAVDLSDFYIGHHLVVKAIQVLLFFGCFLQKFLSHVDQLNFTLDLVDLLLP